MLYSNLIQKSILINKLSPWKYINIDNIVVIEIDDKSYAIEIQNNIIKIFPNNLSTFLYLDYCENLKANKNLYFVEGLTRNFYNSSNMYILEYIYASMLDQKVVDIYEKNNISLNNHDLYCSIEYKDVNKELEIINESNIEEINKILDEFIYFIRQVIVSKLTPKDKYLMYYTNGKVKFVRHQMYMVNLKNKIYFPVFEVKKNSKVIKKSLSIQMRYLGPSLPDQYKIIIASYDETSKKLLTPLALSDLNIKHIELYFNALFEKGIYQKIEVGDFALFTILKRSLSDYLIDLTCVNNNELFDFIFDDYERIITLNNNRKN